MKESNLTTAVAAEPFVSSDLAPPEAPAGAERDSLGRFQPGNRHCWKRGRSGNPKGGRRGASFATALARQALRPIGNRDEMARIAETIGLNPRAAKNLDVVAALFYTTLSRLLLRAATQSGRVDERLVGMLMVLLKALDPIGVKVGPVQNAGAAITTVIANVQTALGMNTTGMATMDIGTVTACPEE